MLAHVSDSAFTTWNDTTVSQNQVYLFDIERLLYYTPDLLDRGVMLAIEKHSLMRYTVKLADMLMGIEPFEEPDFILRDALTEGAFYMISDAQELAERHNLPRPGMSEEAMGWFVYDVIRLAIHLRSHFPVQGRELELFRCDYTRNLVIVCCQ